MKIAILEHLLRLPDQDVFAAAKALGFAGVALSVGAYGGEQKTLFRPDGPATVRWWAKQQGLDIPAISVGWLNRHGLLDPSPETRNQAMELLHRLIDACSVAAIPLLHLPFFGASEIKNESDRHAAIEVLQPFAEHAADKQVMLGLEILVPAEELQRFLEGFSSEAVRAVYDPANARAAGRDAIAEIKMLAGWIGQIQVKDRDRREPFASVALGDGMVDWPAILRALKEIGYDGWLTLDTPSGEEPQGSAKENLSTLSGWLK